MGAAFDIAHRERDADVERIRTLRDRLWQGISSVGDIELNGHPERRVSSVLNVSFHGIEGESLQFALRELAVSAGAACSSASEAGIVRSARARPERSAGAEFAAFQSRPIHDRGRSRNGDSGSEARSDAIAVAVTAGATLMNISEDIPLEYNALVLEHFERPRNAGRFADDIDTIDGVAGSVAHGAMFRLSAQIAQQRIAALRFEAYGCPHCLAAGSWLSERLIGATCEDLQTWQLARSRRCAGKFPLRNVADFSFSRTQYAPLLRRGPRGHTIMDRPA